MNILKIINEANKKLRRCNWSKNDIKNFMKNFDEHYKEELFNECLYNIEDYGLHYEEISDTISSQDPIEFHKRGINNYFSAKNSKSTTNL